MRTPFHVCMTGLSVLLLLCFATVPTQANSPTFTGSLMVPQPTCINPPDASCGVAISAVVSAEAYVQTCVQAVLTAATPDTYQAAITVLAQAIVDLELAVSVKLRVCVPEIVTQASLQADLDIKIAAFVAARADLTAALSLVAQASGSILPLHTALTAGADATLKLQVAVLAMVAQIKAQVRLDLYLGVGSGSCPNGLSLSIDAKIAVLLQACVSLEAALVGSDANVLATAQVELYAAIYAVVKLKIKLSLLCMCSVPVPPFTGSLCIPQPTCANAPGASCTAAVSAIASAEAYVQTCVQAVLTATTAQQYKVAIAVLAKAIVDLELAISIKVRVCAPEILSEVSLQADLDAAISVFAIARAELNAALSLIASASGAVPFNTALIASAEAKLKLQAAVLALVAQIKAQIRLDLFLGVSGSCPAGLSLDLNVKLALLIEACASLEAALLGCDSEVLAAAQLQLHAAILAVLRLKIKLNLLCPCTNPEDGGFVVGDPQFIGLRGQSFQVHGVSGEIYNIVSDSELQYNSRFVFLDQGLCPVVKGRKQKGCWSHPGSYLGELGLKSRAGDHIQLVSGSAAQGFAKVEINGKELDVGDTILLADDQGSVTRNTTHLASVQIGNWDFAFENSDMFVNQRVKVLDSRKLRSHGLLGQTWRDITYPNAVKYIQGEVDDYVIRSADIFGDDFVYNNFN